MDNHCYIFKFETPDSLKALCLRMEALVDNFYDASYGPDGPIPVILLLSELVKEGGPIHGLVENVSERLNEPKPKVAAITLSAIGVVALSREHRWVKEHVSDPSLLTKEWIQENALAISFSAVATRQKMVGLSCACPLCVCVYLGANYSYEEQNLDNLLDNLIAVKGKCGEGCAINILTELSEHFGWRVEE